MDPDSLTACFKQTLGTFKFLSSFGFAAVVLVGVCVGAFFMERANAR